MYVLVGEGEGDYNDFYERPTEVVAASRDRAALEAYRDGLTDHGFIDFYIDEVPEVPESTTVTWAAYEDVYIGAANCSEAFEGDKAVGYPCRVCGKPIEAGQPFAHTYPDRQRPPFEHLGCTEPALKEPGIFQTEEVKAILKCEKQHRRSTMIWSFIKEHMWPIIAIVELVAIVSLIGYGVYATEGARKNLQAAHNAKAECDKAFENLKETVAKDNELRGEQCKSIVEAVRRDCDLISEANKEIDDIYDNKPNVIEKINDMEPNEFLNDVNRWLINGDQASEETP